MKRALLFVLAALVSGAVHAQAWPSKPMIFLNPFPAGGGTDAFARPLAAKLSQQLGQQVAHREPGRRRRHGGRGQRRQARAATATTSSSARCTTRSPRACTPSWPTAWRRTSCRSPWSAFVPKVVVVHPKHAADQDAEGPDRLRQGNPGKLNYGSAGNGTSHHLSVELFKTMTRTFITHIPYRGAGPLMQDLLAGQVDLVFDGMGTSSAQIKAGKLMPLAVTSDAAQSGASRRADRAGGRRAGLRGAHLVRPLGDQGHAEGGHGAHVPGDRQGDERSPS